MREFNNKINLQNANARPFGGDNVFVRGAAITFGSPIKYDGKKLLAFADGLDGLPSVIGSISILSVYKINGSLFEVHQTIA